MTIQQKITCACMEAGITKTELARRLGMSQPNFSQRLKIGKFSDKELQAMAKELGCEYHSYFQFKDGTKFE